MSCKFEEEILYGSRQEEMIIKDGLNKKRRRKMCDENEKNLNLHYF